jgi:hypothetical protein
MLWTIAIIFGLVWMIGLITTYTLGGYIHFLLAVSFVLFLVGAFNAGRKVERRAWAGRAVAPGPNKQKETVSSADPKKRSPTVLKAEHRDNAAESARSQAGRSNPVQKTVPSSNEKLWENPTGAKPKP